MAGEVEHLWQSMPDLANLDPLSKEVSSWLDRAYEAVRRIDRAEGVIFRMHQGYLLHPAEKVVASAEIAHTLERAARTRAIIRTLEDTPRRKAG